MLVFNNGTFTEDRISLKMTRTVLTNIKVGNYHTRRQWITQKEWYNSSGENYLKTKIKDRRSLDVIAGYDRRI